MESKTQFTVTFKDIFQEAKNCGCTPGSKFGSKARDAAETVNAVAKGGVAVVLVYSVIGAGHVAGFAQGFWRGVTTFPNG